MNVSIFNEAVRSIDTPFLLLRRSITFDHGKSRGFVIPTKSFVKIGITEYFVTTSKCLVLSTKCLVLSTKRLVAAAKFWVAATKKLFVVPHFAAVTKTIFFRDRVCGGCLHIASLRKARFHQMTLGDTRSCVGENYVSCTVPHFVIAPLWATQVVESARLIASEVPVPSLSAALPPRGFTHVWSGSNPEAVLNYLKSCYLTL